MFTKEAIETLSQSQAIEATVAAIEAALDNGAVVGLPSDFTLHDLERYLSERRRARGTMTTATVDDFAAYVLGHQEQGATVFIATGNAMSATAVLNLGTPQAPGHADNLAVLNPRATAAYAALRKIADGAGRKQVEVAEFLEDWAPCIQCFNGPDELSLAKAVAAVRVVTIESLRRAQTAEQQLSAQRSTFEEVKATGVDPLPTLIHFKCEPYADLAARTFVLRLSLFTGGDKPALGLRIVQQEKHDQEMADELTKLICNAVGGATPTLLGAYTATR